MSARKSEAARSMQLNLRVPPQILQELERIAEEENLERSAVVRKLLATCGCCVSEAVSGLSYFKALSCIPR